MFQNQRNQIIRIQKYRCGIDIRMNSDCLSRIGPVQKEMNLTVCIIEKTERSDRSFLQSQQPFQVFFICEAPVPTETVQL